MLLVGKYINGDHKIGICSSITLLLLSVSDCHIVLEQASCTFLLSASSPIQSSCYYCWSRLWKHYYPQFFNIVIPCKFFKHIVPVPCHLVDRHWLRLHWASWPCLLQSLQCNVWSGLMMVTMPLFCMLVPNFVCILRTFAVWLVGGLGVFSSVLSICECICYILLGIGMFQPISAETSGYPYYLSQRYRPLVVVALVCH